MQVWLLDKQFGCPVDAMLVPMTDAHITMLNATWVPDFHRQQESSEQDQDFLMWNKGVKYVDLLTEREGVRAYVVCTKGWRSSTQGTDDSTLDIDPKEQI